ncbi:MAG TPA: hypothetical protein VFP35_03865 [Candidatus Saccharimonadales bacterium]|nr:hypothetical protein [Candidatus Saccharimonadales bacterium]
MAEDHFTKLFKYIESFRKDVDEKFDRIDSRLDSLEKLIDKVIKNQELDDEERLVMGHQLDRMDRWVHELADKIGYKLSV